MASKEQKGLNDDIKKKQDVEGKLYIKQINSLKDKLRRLVDLVDRRNLPADFDLNDIYVRDKVPKKDTQDKNEYNIDILIDYAIQIWLKKGKQKAI